MSDVPVTPRATGTPWPPPGAILVYGPSCYGANVPWSPA